MKIRTQLIISMIIFGLALLLISASMIFTNQQVDNLNIQEERAKNIELKANELSYLSSDYILYRESQQITRWESKHASLADDLSKLKVTSLEQQALVNNIQVNHGRLKEVFDDVVSQASGNESALADPAIIQVSWSRIAVQNQGIVFDASRLSQMLREDADQLKMISNLLTLTLLGIVVVFFLTSYLMIYRRTLRSISNLQEGTRIIGSGNLDFAIEMEKDDEIGELSQAFNQMAISLKTVTASKADLEKEIADRKRVEGALRDSQSLLQAVIEGASDPMYIKDREGHLLIINPAMAKVRRKSITEMIGKTDSILYQEAQIEQVVREDDLRVMASGHSEVVEETLPTLDGERTYLTSKSPYRNAKGDISGIIGISYDITERKRTEDEMVRKNEELRTLNEYLTRVEGELRKNIEERAKTENELRQTSRYLENLINIASTPIIVWNPQFCITRFNYAFERLTGLSADSVLGKPLAILFPEKSRTESMNLIQKATSVEPWETVEIPILHRSGAIRTVLWNFASIHGDDEKTIISTIAQGLDITERKKAEEALKEYSMNLKRSNEDLERFAYIASHDLQEPLRNVVSFSQLLSRRYKEKISADADEYIGYIVEGGKRMQALVQDLLEYSRVNTRGQAFEPVVCEEIVERVTRNLQSQIQESDAVIITDPLPRVMADPSQIYLVFQNLIANAIKFRRENIQPHIRISAERADGMWKFAVRDNGIGIDPAFYTRIFEIFQRLHTREKYPGTGVGLAIVKRIIERHGGEIWVESETGKGSTFSFT
jgi:PAS domain S-box-containing protein